MKWPVVSISNKKVGEIELSDDVFGLDSRVDILHRMVRWQRAKAQAGTHATKGISQISGTTKKPWRQKGTGRARAGSMRAPQFRGGATIFGPTSRSHGHKLPKKVRSLALKTALSVKAQEGKLIILDEMDIKSPKTSELKKVLDSNGWKSSLFIGGEFVAENFALASRNIIGVNVLPQQGANVYSILKDDILVLSKDAVHHLEARLK